MASHSLLYERPPPWRQLHHQVDNCASLQEISGEQLKSEGTEPMLESSQMFPLEINQSSQSPLLIDTIYVSNRCNVFPRRRSRGSRTAGSPGTSAARGCCDPQGTTP